MVAVLLVVLGLLQPAQWLSVAAPALPDPAVVRAVASVGQEAGPLELWHSESEWMFAQELVMWTAVNRLASRWFPDDERVAGAYYAADEPTTEQIKLAEKLLASAMAEDGVRDDPTRGSFFVMSSQDVFWLGWPAADVVLWAADGVHGLHLYRSWHGGW